jgi:ribose 5-phosphate isomerase B
MEKKFDTTKPIAIGCDHAGVAYKDALKIYLEQKGFTVKDFGTHSIDSVDYPDYAHAVANSVETGETSFGILFCGSANGVCITANKHQGIRAGLAWNNDVAKLIRKHNNANIICMPARFIALALVFEMTDNFIATEFEGGRHENRVNKIACH